jgi:RNA-directed DNA polymerase
VSPARSPQDASGKGSTPGTFDLLGFTHFWARSRRGNWVVKRRTATSRLQRALGKIAAWCRGNRHEPVAEQHQTLGQKLRGHFWYYGITGNGEALRCFRDGVIRLWRKWLSRRTRGDPFTWERFNLLLKGYPLPAAVVVHSVYR